MPSQLFTDMLVAQPTVLDSSSKDKLRVRFKATQANVINSNRRLYPYAVLNDAIQRSDDRIKQNRMIGESPHPKHFIGKDGQIVFDTRLENSVIKIFNQVIDDSGNVYVDAEVLDTAKGRDLKALIDAGVPVGISMRALGDSVRKQINGVMVDVATRLDIHSYDVVMNPATPGCEVVQVLTDSQVAEVLNDGVQITAPACPDCNGEMTAQDPDGDGDLDFYFCPSCKEVYIPEESKSIVQQATQSLRKLPNDPDWDGYSLARQFKMNLPKEPEEGFTDSLSAAQRKKLKDSDFAVPGKRKLPIHDKEHVKLAWDMVDRTKGLTEEERKEARKRILSAAKQMGVDTSDWNKSMTDQVEGEDEHMDIQAILQAMKDSKEFKELVQAEAQAVAKPALDAFEAQRQAEEEAKAKEQAKAEAKAFVDEKLASLKGKVVDEVLDVIADSVKDAENKEAAGVIIDSVLNIYSKAASKLKLDSIGFDGTKTGEGGQVRVEVTHEPKPWEGTVKALLDSFDRLAQEQGHHIDLSIRKVNQPLIQKMIDHMEKKLGYEAFKDSAAFMDSAVVNTDSVSVTTQQLLNQPTIQQALLIQAFQDVESLQFVATETFEGSEVRWPVETFSSAATIDPTTGSPDLLVGESQGIPESVINLSWLTFTPQWRRNAISLTTDVIRTLQSGPAKYDAISRAIYHIGFDKRRKIDNAIYLEMIMAADEYQPKVVTNEQLSAQAVSNGTNVAYKASATVGGTAVATAGSNPIVRPRTKKQELPNGQVQTTVINPLTVTVGGTTLQQGYLDANGNVQGGQFAVDYENGIFYFIGGLGINPNATTPVLPIASYSAVTNYDRWSSSIPNNWNGRPEDYYNSLLQLITKEVALMASAPRFQRPNLGIMSYNVAAFIENASMWYKLNNPDIGKLSGLAESTFFGQRSGVDLARINAPWPAGDGRILLTQKGATRYAIETGYQIEGPYPKYDANGQIIDAKLYYGRENSCIATPQVTDANGNILNPKLRSIKITA
ncbi:hypothetical protein DNHGIG_25810 [Collibacillus ludicampi]|uniref:Uncharacterized protein n=1 Tax=Collibacillus ludicampi TaxID=2771369 RepID=A0AAV4LGV5_9BACL|nr:DUF6582 domain-containing protein [Collibacillus ludicampi]GIM47032.1 hypothetical protein DNHGIG_25810 [Collibacillus ludicampi]